MSTFGMKWLRSTALMAAAALTLSACSAGSNKNDSSAAAPAGTDAASSGVAGSAPASGNTVARLALTGEPTNLDFTTTAGVAIPLAMMNNVYEGLVTIDQDGAVQPLLASSWTVSDDGLVYDFTLEEGATFSNGSPLNAEAVKFSFERVKSDAWVLSLKNKMNVVDTVEAVSDTEVKVTLSAPSNSWLFDIATSVGAIFSPDGIADLANTPVGTGPYEMAEWKRGQSIKLVAREDYWGDKPATTEVTLNYYADAVATTNALQSGDVDAVINLQAPDLLATFENDDKYEIIQGTSNGEVMLALNNAAAPFDDLKVRQAVAYALDRQAIIDTAWAGYGTVIGSMVPPTDPYFEDLSGEYPYDPEKAKALLAEAGATDLNITFDVPTRPYATAVSEIVVSQLAEVGINATIRSSEFPAVWLDQVFTKKDFQMTVILTVEPRDILTVFNNPDYYIGYDNSKVKDVAAAAVAGSEEEFVTGMKDVAKTVAQDAASPILFLFPNISIATAGLTGVPTNSVSDSLNLRDLSWS